MVICVGEVHGPVRDQCVGVSFLVVEIMHHDVRNLIQFLVCSTPLVWIHERVAGSSGNQ